MSKSEKQIMHPIKPWLKVREHTWTTMNWFFMSQRSSFSVSDKKNVRYSCVRRLQRDPHEGEDSEKCTTHPGPAVTTGQSQPSLLHMALHQCPWVHKQTPSSPDNDKDETNIHNYFYYSYYNYWYELLFYYPHHHHPCTEQQNQSNLNYSSSWYCPGGGYLSFSSS